MESSREKSIVDFFKAKTILVTGSTGFLAKMFVEKLLRVQADVERVFLLIRAADAASAMQRLEDEILGKELFKALKEKHGDGFQSFARSKLWPVAGDIVHENLGIQDSNLVNELFKEVQIIVNVAATTNFYERYDVSLNINVLGAKHVLQFAKQCVKLEMFLHVSTAYVSGTERSGLIPEKRLSMGETLRSGSNSCYLDIEAEIDLVEKKKVELQADHNLTPIAQKLAMKELGMQRARFFGWPNTYVFTKAMGEMVLGHSRGNLPLVIVRPSIITSILRDPLPGWIEGIRTTDIFMMAYADRKLQSFPGDPQMTVDLIPGDMVVNAMMATTVAHSKQQSEFIYHVGSSTRNPITYDSLLQCWFDYFSVYPRTGKDGTPLKITRKMNPSIRTTFLIMVYKFLLQVLGLIHFITCGFIFGRLYDDLNRKYKYLKLLIDLFEPYTFFKGRFDDANLEKLRAMMGKEEMFEMDSKHIEWNSYLHGIHIPGILKYECK
ncbi:probable fatty acyl-CoA reductase 4 [Zingiber officinale]|uniref:probable fatty acyl-CoA reductase 4 n=1 Tax=Zingiber officinale TaxID=94328 RepID=UPI001C4B850E|nr:probable fatty acyl-CoA reductase 4 [Zingiber officinale]